MSQFCSLIFGSFLFFFSSFLQIHSQQIVFLTANLSNLSASHALFTCSFLFLSLLHIFLSALAIIEAVGAGSLPDRRILHMFAHTALISMCLWFCVVLVNFSVICTLICMCFISQARPSQTFVELKQGAQIVSIVQVCGIFDTHIVHWFPCVRCQWWCSELCSNAWSPPFSGQPVYSSSPWCHLPL